ncbi:hypothetical protein B1B00_09835 [Bacillus sp. DSM 27956]|nr:hypothetical protein B1B00_09835 [Bacillus sp. DSM 27956]
MGSLQASEGFTLQFETVHFSNESVIDQIIPREIIFDKKTKKTVALDNHTVIILIPLSRKRL